MGFLARRPSFCHQFEGTHVDCEDIDSRGAAKVFELEVCAKISPVLVVLKEKLDWHHPGPRQSQVKNPSEVLLRILQQQPTNGSLL